MKPNAGRAVATIEKNFTGKTLEMGVRPEDMAHIMGIVADLYTNPAGAVVREYITNAIDSHIEAGQERPVEVTRPDVWNNTLIITDFGIGMDEADMERIFQNYGASTKRDSDIASGMLGIGSKSAFAYSNSFTVRGVKNGVVTLASVSRGENDGGVIDIMDTHETDEGNGVTITIPVSDTYKIVDEINDFCKYLPENAVLVDGEDLSARSKWTHMASNIKDDDGNIVILDMWHNPDASKSRIIMGSVAYEPNSQLVDYGAVIAEVAMGSVVFAPSREKLRDHTLTRKVEDLIRDSYESLYVDTMQKEVNKCTNIYQALNMALRNGRIRGKVTYRGIAMPESHHTIFNNITCTTYVYKERPRYLHKLGATFFTNLDRTLVVHNFDADVLSSNIKRKAIAYADEYTTVHFVREELTGFFARELGDRLVDFSVIKAVELPKSQRAPGKPRQKVGDKHLATYPNGVEVLEDVPDDKEVYYYNKANFDAYEYFSPRGYNIVEDMVKKFYMLKPDAVLFHIYENRKAKFVRDYPEAVEWNRDSIEKIMDDALMSISDEELIKAVNSLNYLNYDSSTLAKIIPSEDEDHHLLTLDPPSDEVRELIYMHNVLSGKDIELPRFTKRYTEVSNDVIGRKEEIVKRYPLANIFYGNLHIFYSIDGARYMMLDYERHLQNKESEKSDEV